MRMFCLKLLYYMNILDISLETLFLLLFSALNSFLFCFFCFTFIFQYHLNSL